MKDTQHGGTHVIDHACLHIASYATLSSQGRSALVLFICTIYPLKNNHLYDKRNHDDKPQLSDAQIRANIERRRAQGLLDVQPFTSRGDTHIQDDLRLRQELTAIFDSQHDYSLPSNTQPIKVDNQAPVFRKATITPDEFKRQQGHSRRLRGLRLQPVKQEIRGVIKHNR